MKKLKKGYSLIELLVVLGIFAILATLATQAVVLTLRSAKKSESSVKVKENLNYSLQVMERQLRSASLILPTSTATKVDYVDNFGNSTYFQCVSSVTDNYIASGSATIRLSSSEVKVTPCSFSYSSGFTSVTINLTGTSASASGIENTLESVSSTVVLRQSN